MISEDWKSYGEWVVECERGNVRQTESGALIPSSAAWVREGAMGKAKAIRYDYYPTGAVVGPVPIPDDAKMHYFRRVTREGGVLTGLEIWIGWRRDDGTHYYRSIDVGTGQTFDDVHP